MSLRKSENNDNYFDMERDILESNSIALDGRRIEAFNECRLQQWRNQ